MTSNREHLFPATSIGRTQGSRLQRVPSHESLTAHPLLSSNHSPGLDHGVATANSGSQRYVPYTPRQRVTPTAATTGTTVHPPSPQHQQGDATSKLQLMNMKAAAQNVGLDAGSVGWALLETLMSESDQPAEEWTEIWTAITTNKATLLLPLEQVHGHEQLTPEFIKDHIILCDGPSRNNTQIVTLSGLRGILNDTTLTLRSSIHPASKIFQDLVNPSTRSTALTSLPSLPLLATAHVASTSYPTFSLPSHTSSIPLPPRSHSAPQSKPPLPPRPGNRTASGTTNTHTSASRISNPFASLFGGSGPNIAKPPVVSAIATSPTSITASPPASVRSFDSNSPADSVVDISGFTIDRKIVRKDVGKEMNKALRKEVKASLSEASLPTWAIDRVHEFTAEWYPIVKEKPQPYVGRKPGKGLDKEGGGDKFVVNWAAEAPEISAERLQDFYLGLEQDLRIGGMSFWERARDAGGEGEKNEKTRSNEGSEDDKRVRDKIDNEAKIKEAMDVVERTICSLFYDRLYMQPTSDDASHDEALSSRVAALNMLDLGLEHLDIHVDNAGPELDLVVKACGEMLSQLEECRSPSDKAAILVAAHKIIVDGLSRLPPIRLMSEEESKAQKAKASSIVPSKSEVPPRGADGKLRILTPDVPDSAQTQASDTMEQSAELTAPEVDETDLKTPHAPINKSSASPIPIIVEPEPANDDTKPEQSLSSKSPTAPTPSPMLTMSPKPSESTPVSGDVLLPMIIFSVVKANPPHLVSNLLYTQRYRNQSVGGEESYCLINLMAVAEFLENVDLAALGLGDSDKVLSAADLTPIPLNRSPMVVETPLAPADGLPGSLRGRVEQANKVITGVVDSSFGMLRSLLPNTPVIAPLTPPVDGVQSAAPWNAVKPGFGLLRRESGFSIKSITSALPITRGGAASRSGTGEEAGQQLVTVSRPSSVKSSLRGEQAVESGSEMETEESGEESASVDDNDEDEEEGDNVSGFGDARSIRSFESMLSAKDKKKDRKTSGTRKSLSDRLAHMSSLAALKGSPPPSRRASLLPQGPSHPQRPDSPASPRPESPMPLRLAPPIQRFVECTPGDLKLSEVGELLRDYRRLVQGVRAVGGFDE